jgi:hypothetical protein
MFFLLHISFYIPDRDCAKTEKCLSALSMQFTQFIEIITSKLCESEVTTKKNKIFVKNFASWPPRATFLIFKKLYQRSANVSYMLKTDRNETGGKAAASMMIECLRNWLCKIWSNDMINLYLSRLSLALSLSNNTNSNIT